MRVVVALGGNALLARGQAMTAENQRQNVKIAAEHIAKIADGNQICITHGNGPQVGILALQAAAYTDVSPYPLDVLGAQTEAQIGYMIEQELGNLLPFERRLATLLTMVEVDRNDPAFSNPTKPIGPVYEKAEAEQLAKEKGWQIAPDGDKWRRVVASPRPQHIFELPSIKRLLESYTIVTCAGGGGIPCVYDEDRKLLSGIEAVIDKDLASAILATELKADVLIIATDVDGVYLDWGQPTERKIEEISATEIEAMQFPAGSMGPKVKAACEFAKATGKFAMIGSIANLSDLVYGKNGTRIIA